MNGFKILAFVVGGVALTGGAYYGVKRYRAGRVVAEKQSPATAPTVADTNEDVPPGGEVEPVTEPVLEPEVEGDVPVMVGDVVGAAEAAPAELTVAERRRAWRHLTSEFSLAVRKIRRGGWEDLEGHRTTLLEGPVSISIAIYRRTEEGGWIPLLAIARGGGRMTASIEGSPFSGDIDTIGTAILMVDYYRHQQQQNQAAAQAA